MKFTSLAFTAISALVLSACGGGGGGTLTPVIDKDLHIKGTVNETVIKATNNPVGFVDGSSLVLRAYTEPTRVTWEFASVPNAKGTYSCAANGVQIWFHQYQGESRLGYVAASNEGGSSCTVTVNAISNTEVSGTFNATMVHEDGTTATPITVKNGSFRMPTNLPPDIS